MRDYGKISPTFWTGKTGREIKRRGIEGVVMATYLMTSPHSNMLGLFYQPMLYAAHETGLGIEGATKGLQCCIEAGFCAFDEETDMVWVYEMAAYQIADSLSSGDKRCKGIQKDYDALPDCAHLAPFFDRYAEAYNLTTKRGAADDSAKKSEAPSKPHRSQEQEQEQEYPSDMGREVPSQRPAKKCPKSFIVTDELIEWARSSAPAVDLKTETEKFRDHTFASARTDWAGTWRNWIRKAQEVKGGRPSSAANDVFAGAK
ncbi:hypothetical protein [Flavobacterium sp.]|jgi:hypothetical protein|uniref:hypothetical protein n=1 Tax=Flavobacterium sp. TaxID=239 RepID=UPI0037BEF11F